MENLFRILIFTIGLSNVASLPSEQLFKEELELLLTRHSTVPVEANENAMAHTRIIGRFPIADLDVLPDVILWDPLIQFPEYFPKQLNCPRCQENQNASRLQLKESGWKDARSRRHSPRSIYGTDGKVLVVSREYSCRKGHEIAAHDPTIVNMLPVKTIIPFVFTHKSGMTTELLNYLMSMIRNGLTFVQVHNIFEERLRRRHLNAERRFLYRGL